MLDLNRSNQFAKTLMQSSMVKATMRKTSRVSRRKVTPVPQGWISAPMMLTAKFCGYE